MDNFTNKIYLWYNDNKRELPWRKTDDPYKIWISEIILQQTRVSQGIDYYLNFIDAFPNVKSLAEANEDEVLKLWQGLGYYSRARNLHSASKEIMEKHNGIFPHEYSDILNLKGIGNYTAAAIASIAFGLPYPVVDGNIYRLFSRYYGIETPIDTNVGYKEFRAHAQKLMPNKNPGFHNQALMEFGALCCVPKSPGCVQCPLSESCFAFNNNIVDRLPVKAKKVKQTTRYFYYYLLVDGNSIYLEKRTQNDIWKNLYQLPLLETSTELTDQQIINTEVPFITNGLVNLKSISSKKKHVLSHQVIYARLIETEIENNTIIRSNLIQVNKKDIYKFAVPRLVEQFLNDFNLECSKK